jgi:3-isopropylmalate/(R)-2-methylmalate dehydratase large subunit
MEQRMTLCNMSIEGGARAGMVAPDEVTYEYLAGKPFAPQGKDWDDAVKRWSSLGSDPGSFYDRQITLDADTLEPMITFGTNPSMAVPIHSPIPDKLVLSGTKDPQQATLENAFSKALAYMDLKPGQSLVGKKVQVVFIGSCTNGRLSDLRSAAGILRGRRISAGLRVLVVPGSQQVKRQAEAEGLDRIFKEAGAEWREPGCSMCIAMNGDQLEPGQYAVSTSNRNFEGRQGKGGRTFLASPLTAAAAAVTGCITDPRTLM